MSLQGNELAAGKSTPARYEIRGELAEMDLATTKLATERSRRSFLTATAGLGTAVWAGFGATSSAEAADAERFRGFSGSHREFTAAFQSIVKHENAHVAFLKKALGAAARPKPNFKGLDQKHVKDFIVLARAFENTGSGAYLNAAPAIKNPAYLAAAGSIALVEGRHAGFLNVATTEPITLGDADFEAPISPTAVGKAVAPYIKDLNGGPPLTYSSVRSDANDIKILNFALALEYLEAEYYNINVSKFF